jgi:hypothetical protein
MRPEADSPVSITAQEIADTAHDWHPWPFPTFITAGTAALPFRQKRSFVSE